MQQVVSPANVATFLLYLCDLFSLAVYVCITHGIMKVICILEKKLEVWIKSSRLWGSQPVWGIFQPSNIAWGGEANLLLRQGSWLMSGFWNMKWTSETQAGQATGNQRLLCPHLYRDLAPPQHPESKCYTWRDRWCTEPTECRTTTEPGEVDLWTLWTVFILSMLSADIKSCWLDIILKMTHF